MKNNNTISDYSESNNKLEFYLRVSFENMESSNSNTTLASLIV